MRTIRVCVGIGDNLWLIQKLASSGEKFNIVIPHTEPNRAHQVFEVFPQITHSVCYDKNNTFSNLDVIENTITKKVKNFSEITDETFYLCANTHLEEGKLLDDFLPDLKTQRLEPVYQMDVENEADKYLYWGDVTYIGIYASSYSVTRNWGFWDEKKWIEFMDLILFEHDRAKEIVFVLIGANFDTDMGEKIIALAKSRQIKIVSAIGARLDVTVYLLKKMQFLAALASGIPIIATNCSVPNIMFYPPDITHRNMLYTWPFFAELTEKRHIPTIFTDPESAVKLLNKNWLL